jgi:hypothetical protein
MTSHCPTVSPLRVWDSGTAPLSYCFISSYAVPAGWFSASHSSFFLGRRLGGLAVPVFLGDFTDRRSVGRVDVIAGLPID